jgi:hypothetical protein
MRPPQKVPGTRQPLLLPSRQPSLPAPEVPKEHTVPEPVDRRAAPAGGAKRGPLAPVTGPVQQIERSPSSSRYSTRRPRLAHTTAAASLH